MQQDAVRIHDPFPSQRGDRKTVHSSRERALRTAQGTVGACCIGLWTVVATANPSAGEIMGGSTGLYSSIHCQEGWISTLESFQINSELQACLAGKRIQTVPRSRELLLQPTAY